MNKLRLLIVEDNIAELEVCRSSVDMYKHQHQCEMEVVECQTLDDAINKIDASYDGAIVDLTLDHDSNAGNLVLKKISDHLYRIPVIIFTGTPAEADGPANSLGIYTKGSKQYTDFFDEFWQIHNTGLTKIVGGRGLIETTLNKVFLENLLPQRQTWIKYATNVGGTEKALIRHTINHLYHLLDENDDKCFPEEVYIFPPPSDGYTIGSVVKHKGDDDSIAVILNPICDLVIRPNGSCKTDRFLLVEIEDLKSIIDNQLSGITKPTTRKSRLETLLKNNENDYHHWLPETAFFPGGFLNFRKLKTLSAKHLNILYSKPYVQISQHFVKDITARFSNYYARQGQPELDKEQAITKFV